MAFTTIKDTLAALPNRWNLDALKGWAGIVQYHFSDAAQGDPSDLFVTFDGTNKPVVTEGVADTFKAVYRMAASDFVRLLNGEVGSRALAFAGKLDTHGSDRGSLLKLSYATPQPSKAGVSDVADTPPGPSAAYLAKSQSRQEAVEAVRAQREATKAKIADLKAAAPAKMAAKSGKKVTREQFVAQLQAKHPKLVIKSGTPTYGKPKGIRNRNKDAQ